MPIVFQQHDVPAVIRPRSSLARVDYVDLFTVVTDGAAGASPEQWARAGLEDAAGLAGQFVWRVLCGLRLERRPSPGDSFANDQTSRTGAFLSVRLALRDLIEVSMHEGDDVHAFGSRDDFRPGPVAFGDSERNAR